MRPAEVTFRSRRFIRGCETTNRAAFEQSRSGRRFAYSGKPRSCGRGSMIHERHHVTRAQYVTEFEPSARTLWGWLCPTGTPCFTSRLLGDIRRVDVTIEGGAETDMRYYVLGSRLAGAVSCGGDLELCR